MPTPVNAENRVLAAGGPEQFAFGLDPILQFMTGSLAASHVNFVGALGDLLVRGKGVSSCDRCGYRLAGGKPGNAVGCGGCLFKRFLLHCILLLPVSVSMFNVKRLNVEVNGYTHCFIMQFPRTASSHDFATRKEWFKSMVLLGKAI
jgi:hypothetical protein